MIAGPVLQNMINQARQEIKPNNSFHGIFSYEQKMLLRLISAIDMQNDAELIATVFQIKAELNTLRCSVLTVLPALIFVLAEELTDKH